MTEQELKEKLDLLNLKDEKQIKDVVCSLIGHSKIYNCCFGYVYCERCGEQIGDSLGGYFSGNGMVHKDYEGFIATEDVPLLSWKDTFMVDYKTMPRDEIKEKNKIDYKKLKEDLDKASEEMNKKHKEKMSRSEDLIKRYKAGKISQEKAQEELEAIKNI